MSLKKYFVAVSAVFSFASGMVSAAVVNFQFTGTVTDGGALAAAGSQVVGTFSYDTDIPPSYLGYSSYYFPAPFGFSANVGGHTVTTNDLSVTVWNNAGGNAEDMIDIYGHPAIVDGNIYPDGLFGFRLASGPGSTNVWASTALPSFLDVTAFDSVGLNSGALQSSSAPGGGLLEFSVDSITVVPLPSALVLMISGMLMIGGLFRRSLKQG